MNIVYYISGFITAVVIFVGLPIARRIWKEFTDGTE